MFGYCPDMFVAPLNLFVVQIPKTGTRTLHEAVRRQHGDDAIVFSEHDSILRMFEKASEKGLMPDGPPDVMAVVREPVSRFISALNHSFGEFSDEEVSLDDAISRAFDSRRNRVFRAQCGYIDTEECNLQLIPFDHFDAALERVGYRGPSFNDSASIKRWRADDIKKHPRGKEILEHCRLDDKLYERAVSGWLQLSTRERMSCG